MNDMNKQFQTLISAFPTVKGTAHSTTLEKWIRSTINPTTAAEIARVRLIEAIRNEPDEERQKELKKQLPAITPGALFPSGSGHAKTDPHAPTSWMQFDIDLKENSDLVTGEVLRDVVAKIKYVAFVGLSTRGKGVWGLVYVSNLERRADHFTQLQTDFKAKGIILDSTKGANANDLRYYSFDPNAIIKTDFKEYERLPASKKLFLSPRRYEGNNTEESKIAEAVNEITRRGIDITDGYRNWFEIGCSIAQTLGEAGGVYFHDLSRMNAAYRERETDQQYSACLKNNGYRYAAGTFFHHCKMSGISLETSRPIISQPIRRPAPEPILNEKTPLSDHYARTRSEPFIEPLLNEKGYPADWDTLDAKPDNAETLRFQHLVKLFDLEIEAA
jgi:hypothetical protein